MTDVNTVKETLNIVDTNASNGASSNGGQEVGTGVNATEAGSSFSKASQVNSTFSVYDPNTVLDNLVVLNLQQNQYGGKYAGIKVNQNGNRSAIFVQFPKMHTPTGFFEYTPKKKENGEEPMKNNGPQYLLMCDVDIASSNPPTVAMLNFVKMFEQKVKDHAVKNADTWFKGTDLEAIPHLIKPMITKGKDSHSLIFNIKKFDKFEGDKPWKQFAVRVYHASEIERIKSLEERGIRELPVPSHPSIISKSSEVIPMVHFPQVTIHAGRYKIKAELDHVVVYPSITITGNCINLVADDEYTIKRLREQQDNDPNSKKQRSD